MAIPEDQIEVPQARRQIQKYHSNYGQVLQTPKALLGGVDPKPFRQVVLDWKAQREVSQYDNATGDANQDQVCSLTQLYSVDFSKSRIVGKKCIFNKRIIEVCVNCF